MAATALLGAVGIGLLVAAQSLPAAHDEAVPAPAPSADAGRAPPSTAPGLRPSAPRPPDGEGGARAEHGGRPPPPAAVGTALPRQWPEFRPTRIVLRPVGNGPSAPVDPVGVEGDDLTLPDDADRVGWWRGGSRAGVPFGTAVLAGHLDTDDDPAGYLAALTALEVGDLVELSSASGRQRYQVRRNYLLPSADLSARSDLFEQRRSHRLLLVTCGGPYDHERGRYRDNRVVEAVPLAG